MSDEENKQFRLRNKIDLSDDQVRLFIKNIVLELGIKFHDERTSELNTWVKSQPSPPTPQQISDQAKVIWENAVALNSDHKISCWGNINGNQKVIDKDVHYFDSLPSKIEKLKLEIIKKRKDFENLKEKLSEIPKDEDLINRVKVREEAVGLEVKEIENEIDFLKAPFLRYQPLTHWDSMKLMVSNISVTHFKEDINSLDTPSLILIIEKTTPKTSLCREKLPLIRDIRNKWAHKNNLTSEQVNGFILDQRLFVKTFFPLDEAKISEVDAEFDRISHDVFHQVNLRKFPTKSSFYIGDQFNKIKNALTSLSGKYNFFFNKNL